MCLYTSVCTPRDRDIYVQIVVCLYLSVPETLKTTHCFSSGQAYRVVSFLGSHLGIAGRHTGIASTVICGLTVPSCIRNKELNFSFCHAERICT